MVDVAKIFICAQASREHYCVHKTVSKKSNRDEECDKLLREDGGCRFYTNVGKLFGLQKGRAMRVSLP